MIVVLLYFTVLLLGLFRLFKSDSRFRNFPPGPRCYPLLGHLPLLGSLPHKTIWGWKRTFGSIIGLHLGKYRAVILNDAQLTGEVFRTGAVSGRPTISHVTMDGEASGIIFTDGVACGEQREFTVKNLRDFGFGHNSMESKIQDEIIGLMGKLKAGKGRPTRMNGIFPPFVLSLLWRVMYGDRLSKDDPEFLEALQRLTVEWTNGAHYILQYLAIFAPSWLAGLIRKFSGFRTLQQNLKSVQEILWKHLHSHSKTHVEGHPRDFVDAYMDKVLQTEDGDSSFLPGKNTVLFTVSDVLLSGVEKTSTCLSWLCLYLVTHLHVQRQLQLEIDVVIGRSRFPGLKHRPAMPYTEAIILEVIRHSSFLPFAYFHATVQDVRWQEYDIPRGTVVIPNLYGAHHDASVWEDPQNFRPERFLELVQGRLVLRPLKEKVFAFGGDGNARKCVGERLARDILFLFTTHLFQRFQARPTEVLPNLEPKAGFILVPQSYEIIWEDR